MLSAECDLVKAERCQWLTALHRSTLFGADRVGTSAQCFAPPAFRAKLLLVLFVPVLAECGEEFHVGDELCSELTQRADVCILPQ